MAYAIGAGSSGHTGWTTKWPRFPDFSGYETDFDPGGLIEGRRQRGQPAKAAAARTK
jgi:hypothetical protein